MEAGCISFQQVPGVSALYLDYLYQFSCLSSFYQHDPYAPASFASAAKEVELDEKRRAQLVEVLTEQNKIYGGDERCRENIERLRQPGGVAVVTGQQVGLFGGPAYSVYKAITTIRLAAKLTEEGISAVPVFWMATYDHDFAEVNHTTLLDSSSEFLELRAETKIPKDMQVGEAVFGPGIRSLREKLCRMWPPETRAEAEDLLAGYDEGATYAEAFGKLFQQLFAGQGLVVLDPRDARLQRMARPVYERALDEADELVPAMQQRSLDIGHAGYHAQVEIKDNSTFLFGTLNGARRPVHRKVGKFSFGEKGERPKEKFLQELAESPEQFSPGALLRPVVQDWLLPTVAYVGGPAEIAYFAQSSLLYDRLLGRMPVLVPRTSLTLVEPKVARVLAKYNLSVCDAFVPFTRLQNCIAEQRLPKRLQSRLERTDGKIDKLLADTLTAVGALDPTLAGAVETSRRKMQYQFSKIRGKVARAQAEKTGIVDRHTAMLHNSLFPSRGLQERQVNFLSFVSRYGLSLIPQLLERDDLLRRDHIVVSL